MILHHSPNHGSTTTVEMYDHGPEPDWHKDRRLYSAWWGRYELRATDSDGETIVVARGCDERDAWYRLGSEMGHRNA